MTDVHSDLSLADGQLDVSVGLFLTLYCIIMDFEVCLLQS